MAAEVRRWQRRSGGGRELRHCPEPRVGGGQQQVPGAVLGWGAQQSTQPLRGRLLRWLRRAALRAALQASTKMSPMFSWYLAEHSK